MANQISTNHSATSRNGNSAAKLDDGALTAGELDAIVGGQAAEKGTMGGGNASIWSKIKSVMFGVDANFY